MNRRYIFFCETGDIGSRNVPPEHSVIVPFTSVVFISAVFLAVSSVSADPPLLYGSDFSQNSIWSIDISGVESTLATGLSGPHGLAISPSGMLYVANFYSGSIDEVSPNGNLTPFVNGLNDPQDMVFNSSGDIIVATTLNNGSIQEITPSGAISTLATGLTFPQQLAIDEIGNVYFDTANVNTISEMSPSGAISTFATGISQPGSMAFDAAGNLYVTSGVTTGNIEKITPSRNITTVASGIPNLAALCFDGTNNLYYAGGGINEISVNGTVSNVAMGLDNPSTMVSATTASAPIPIAGPFTHDGHTYYLLSNSTWTAAESEAVALGGHLASVHSAEENNWIVSTFSTYDGMQRELAIGLSDVTGTDDFQWTDGTDSSYANWAPGEPNFIGSELYTYILPPEVSGGEYWNNDYNRATATYDGLGGNYGPFAVNGVVEILPEPTTGSLLLIASAGALMCRWRSRLA